MHNTPDLHSPVGVNKNHDRTQNSLANHFSNAPNQLRSTQITPNNFRITPNRQSFLNHFEITFARTTTVCHRTDSKNQQPNWIQCFFFCKIPPEFFRRHKKTEFFPAVNSVLSGTVNCSVIHNKSQFDADMFLCAPAGWCCRIPSRDWRLQP